MDKAKNKYEPKTFEEKWSKEWLKSKIYNKKELKKGDKKYYSLYSFPYPSGAGLHVGHVEGMVANDISARYYRMKSYNSFLPMGWDSFGLPAENYAIKTGKHPKITTDDAIKTFISQINKIGIGVDWTSEVGAHTPEYYKWTQWIFLQMYKQGVAYKANAPVNWCNSCQTVLANEQVVEGNCERCGNVVVQKQMNQWFYKITDYADRLVDDLKSLDWPNGTKQQQLNWIGKSEGAEIEFPIHQLNNTTIKVFTTRPDTIFGVTFMVLAPEHPIVEELLQSKVKSDELKVDEIKKYLEKTKRETELQRQTNKEKTGVYLGIKAINPVNGNEIPIFISDYILMGYGTGAIMAVPAHDDRDYEFANKFNIDVIPVVKSNQKLPYTAEGEMINSDYLNGLHSHKDKERIISILAQKIGATKKTTYKLRDWLLSRQRYWGAPIPIVYDPKGKAHAVKEEHLPWLLPTDVDFIPKGYAPLSRSKELLERTEKLYGKGWKPEVDTMDTFVDSSWYFLRHLDAKNSEQFVSKNLADQWLPVDLYMIGAEHIVLHLLYARFFTKFLYDNKFIGFNEPFYKMRHMGTILGPDGKKMSKRWGNVINPSDVSNVYGADSIRLYEMFMAPLELEKPWNDSAIAGVYRFLGKVWDLMHTDFTTSTDQKLFISLNDTITKVTSDIEELKFNTAISSMMKFVNNWNLLNINSKRNKALNIISKEDALKFLKILAPFAPFITEELNSKIFNNVSSIHTSNWPKPISNNQIEKTFIIPIQINGKVRGEIKILSSISKNKDQIIEQAKTVVQNYLNDTSIVNVIYVENKIINFVVK